MIILVTIRHLSFLLFGLIIAYSKARLAFGMVIGCVKICEGGYRCMQFKYGDGALSFDN
jgi:hypothetical protein